MSRITPDQVVPLYEVLDTENLLVFDGAFARVSGKYQRQTNGNIAKKEEEGKVI